MRDSNRKIYIAFVILASFLSVYYVDLWRNGNTVSRLLPVKAYAESGTWCIDNYHEETIDKALINGHYYSEKAPLPAWIVTPVYVLLYKTGLHTCMEKDNLLYLTGDILIAVIPFILIILLIYHQLIRKKWNIYHAMFISLALPFSTFIWIYAGTAFSHVLAGLWLVLSYIYIREKRNFLLAGLFAGFCFITEYPCGLLFIIWAFVILYQEKKIKAPFLFGVGALPSLLAQLIYNYQFTGNAFDMLYNHQAIDFYHDPNTFIGFALPIPEAMWKLLFGFYRGWLFHAPVLILFFAMLMKQTVKTPAKMIFNFLVPALFLSYLLFSSYRVWYGGWCFGPRHFVPLTALLLYHFAPYCQFKGLRHYIFISLIGAGIIYCWMAKSTLLYSINADFKNPLTDLLIPAFQNKSFNENNIFSLLFGVSPIASSVLWIILLLTTLSLLYRKYLQTSLQKVA